MTTETPTIYQIALAFARANETAGMSYKTESAESAEVRAQNLVRCGYVRAGDPYGWASPGSSPAATIYAEEKGTSDDCVPPADYYGRWPNITPYLPGWYWEWQNAAVAHVWPC